uniref:Uncharacterized protein n=1 Tax=Salix viminalis TaxID=40686 RepID=A0A6N2N747_SALVM
MAWFLVGLSRRSVVSLRGFSASVGCSIRYEDVNHSASKNGSPLATPLLPTARSHGCSGNSWNL